MDRPWYLLTTVVNSEAKVERAITLALAFATKL